MTEARRALKEIFGYDDFRPGQETLISALLSGRDALGVMPTGAGKSVCFQIPALLSEGVALVISPLISLMKDQVGALTQAGVRAAYLNSSLSPAQLRKALANACAGMYKIIYVAPERLLTEDMAMLARARRVSLVAVDEAHCVSKWGQDFRPSYLDIPRFIDTLPERPPVAAFTATATEEVRADVENILRLREPERVVTGFDRPNLWFEVLRPEHKRDALLELMERFSGRSGIVYCNTRKNVDTVCALLNENGYLATRYHAGLSDEERAQNQEDFIYDRKSVVVATNAFGMGIDKSNVGFVIHYNMPSDLESYYQEAGRAGRDGAPADCVLLYGGQDVMTARFLLEHGNENEELSPEEAEALLRRNLERLHRMTIYATTNDCLRGYILRYFGEEAPLSCGKCYNCAHEFEKTDATEEGRAAVACVTALPGRYGRAMICDILRGQTNERVARFGLDALPSFGALRALSARRVQELLRALLVCEYLRATDGEYPTLVPGPRADALLRGEAVFLLRLPEERADKKRRAPARSADKKGRASAKTPEKARRAATNAARRDAYEDADAVVDPHLFEELRALRMRVAAVQHVPAYLVFTDETLRDMCAKLPVTEEELLTVSGVGAKKCEKYARYFLPVIKTFKRV